MGDTARRWALHVAQWKDCVACPLGEQRHRICLARGDIPCDVLFIGEAPGAGEDATGKPFVGPAGALLETIRERALPSDCRVAFTNLVACFPREAKTRGDNEPERGEILECKPRLIEFVNIAQPKLLVCVGSLTHHHIGHKDTIACVDIVHPAYILARMPKVQQGFAAQKCVVQIRNAYAQVLEQNRPYTEWGAKHAGKSINERLKKDDDLPF